MLQLKLIDFGLCTNYLDENGNHIAKSALGFRGNIAFSSPNAMMNNSTSRRDDLVSLAYLLLYLHNSTLAFFGINQTESEFQEILDAKLNCSTQALCGKKSEELLAFVNEIFNMRFDTTPNYKKL